MRSSSALALFALTTALLPLLCRAFSAAASRGATDIFGVPGAGGWTSPNWNWGSPVGTGHDCAMVCRRRFATAEVREDLVNELIGSGSEADDGNAPSSSKQQSQSQSLSFEEIKLVLALAFQRARRTLGLEAYGQILDEMAKAERYEIGDDEACSRLFVQDLQKHYVWLEPEVGDKIAMNLLWYETDDCDVARRRCSGLLLKSIGFIEDGL